MPEVDIVSMMLDWVKMNTSSGSDIMNTPIAALTPARAMPDVWIWPSA